jgi:hypothetical protein
VANPGTSRTSGGFTRHLSTAAYLASAEGKAYMARLNRQPNWVSPAVIAAKEAQMLRSGIRRKCRRVKHQNSGMIFDSIASAARHFGVSTCVINKSLDAGEMSKFGMFVDATAAEWAAWQDANPQPEYRCTKCETMKRADEFSTDKSKSNGRSSWCRECVRIANNERRRNNRKARIAA